MKIVVSVCAALALAAAGGAARAQVMLAAGEPADSFVTANWVANVPGPMDVAFLPDGRALILLKEGEVVVRTAEGMLVRNAGTLAVKPIDNEQGLLGAVAHPDYASNKTIFFYASIGADIASKNQILRGTIGDDHKLTFDTANPLIVFEGPHKHQGSGLHIHKGHLYVATGDSGNQNPLPTNKYASCLNKPNGKILRLNLDGSAPADNPLAGMTQVTGCTTETRLTGNFSTQPPDRRIWAWGLRNPFKVWLDPETDLFWLADVGERQREEVSVGGRGQHFGYPFEEGTYKYSRQQIPFDTIGGCKGMAPSIECSPPVFEYPNGGAGGDSAIIGGLIPSGCGWPAAFTGRYVFGDHMSGRLWTLDVTPDRRSVVPNSRKNFGSLRGIVGFRMGPDGSLYLASFEANAVARVTPKNRPATCPTSPADAGAAPDTPSVRSRYGQRRRRRQPRTGHRNRRRGQQRPGRRRFVRSDRRRRFVRDRRRYATGVGWYRRGQFRQWRRRRPGRQRRRRQRRGQWRLQPRGRLQLGGPRRGFGTRLDRRDVPGPGTGEAPGTPPPIMTRLPSLGLLFTCAAAFACQPAGDPAPLPQDASAPRADRPATPDRQPPPDAEIAPDTQPPADAAAACPAPRLDCESTRPLPQTLSETGLFPSLPDPGPVASGAHRFQPAWPLWSDGLTKERQVIVPQDKAVDASDRQAWQFPVGTLFVKTFFADGTTGGRRPIETRIIRRVDSDDPFQQWQYAVYAWNSGATDATLLDLQARTPIDVTVGGQRFTHQIPSREDCGKCHEANTTAIIGFDESRLAWAPSGAGETELARFRRLGLITGGPTAPPAPISDADATLGALKGYVLGNCVHCHDGRNPTVVDMRPGVLAANMICKPTTSSGTAAGTLVVPGRPETSIFYLQIARTTGPGINPMPPVGVQRPDTQAVDLARRSITSLRNPCP